ncbi:MAG: hypothetical protein LBR73_10195 [Oscillospiraceae bacterium]|nr:hypothetical protein [Oscillospiraceae bacterium]
MPKEKTASGRKAELLEKLNAVVPTQEQLTWQSVGFWILLNYSHSPEKPIKAARLAKICKSSGAGGVVLSIRDHITRQAVAEALQNIGLPCMEYIPEWARHIGNTRGHARSAEWSVVPTELENPADWDIGSRKAIQKALKAGKEIAWLPCYMPVSNRPSFEYIAKEDMYAHPLAQLLDNYYDSVGKNASLILNVPLNPEGQPAEQDVTTLLHLGAQLTIDFKEDLAQDSGISATQSLDTAHRPENVLLSEGDVYWHSGAFTKPVELVLDLGDDYDVNKCVLMEHSPTGQQIERFSLHYETPKGKWQLLKEGTTVGYKRILKFHEKRMRRLKLIITESRGFATLDSWQCY